MKKKQTSAERTKKLIDDSKKIADFAMESLRKRRAQEKPIKLTWLVISATGTHPGIDSGPVPRIGVYIHRINAVNQEEAKKEAAKAIIRCHWAHVVYKQHVVSATVVLEGGFGASGSSS